MATPVSATSDIWYGSVEDLLSALDKGSASAASSAFTINLQTSALPARLTLKGALTFEGLHVYQLQQRLGNGLSQFQLRLGIIESDLQADAILATVRQHYPGATKKFAGETDRTTIARLLSLSARRVAPAVPPVLPAVSRPVPKAKAAAIDSTQTVRALNAVELRDEAASWFVIQLSRSAQHIDPEQVPSLDIFAEYRLYEVRENDERQRLYALRLGFFSSEVAAKAVAGYLAPHFPATTIRRVSAAEHERFAQNRVVPRKDIGETGRHAVIEFSSPPALPSTSSDDTLSAAPEKRPASAASSLWSRLMARRLQR